LVSILDLYSGGPELELSGEWGPTLQTPSCTRCVSWFRTDGNSLRPDSCRPAS